MRPQALGVPASAGPGRLKAGHQTTPLSSIPSPAQYVLCVGLTPCLQRTLSFASLRPGEVNRAQSVVGTASGKGTNVARIVQSLGGRSLLTGFAGGQTGDDIVARLDAIDLPHRFTRTVAPTRVCQSLIDLSARSVTELVEEATLPSDGEWKSFWELLPALLSEAALMVIAGSPPPGSPLQVYHQALQLARAAHCPAIIDAQKEYFLQALPSGPLVAKLNVEELARTVGRRLGATHDVRRAALELRQGGAQTVLVTHGAHPALFVTQDEIWSVTPPTIEALNPIGSGDAMGAGMAFALIRGQEWPEVLRYGMACGAANALTLTSGTVDPQKVLELLPQVKLEKVSD